MHDPPASGQAIKDKAEAPSEDPHNLKATVRAQPDGAEASVKQPSKARDDDSGCRDAGLRPGTRTVLVTDMAFQTCVPLNSVMPISSTTQ